MCSICCLFTLRPPVSAVHKTQYELCSDMNRLVPQADVIENTEKKHTYPHTHMHTNPHTNKHINIQSKIIDCLCLTQNSRCEVVSDSMFHTGDTVVKSIFQK